MVPWDVLVPGGNQAWRNLFEATWVEVIIFKLKGKLQQTYWDFGENQRFQKKNTSKPQKDELFL